MNFVNLEASMNVFLHFYHALPSLKNVVYTHVKYRPLPSFVFRLPCLINTAQRDEIKSHVGGIIS